MASEHISFQVKDKLNIIKVIRLVTVLHGTGQINIQTDEHKIM